MSGPPSVSHHMLKEDDAGDEHGAKYRRGTAISICSDGSFKDFITPMMHEGFSSADCPVPRVSVLCVEDDRFQQEALLELFSLANAEEQLYDVKIAGSSDEALAILQAGFKPDLVMLDVILNGDEETEHNRGDKLLPKLQALFEGKELPSFVFASVLSHVKRVNNLCSLGVDGFLVKPIAPSTIRLMWQFCYPVAQRNAQRSQPPGMSHGSEQPLSVGHSPHSGAIPPLAARAREGGAGGGIADDAGASSLRAGRGYLQPARRHTMEVPADEVGACKQQ